MPVDNQKIIKSNILLDNNLKLNNSKSDLNNIKFKFVNIEVDNPKFINFSNSTPANNIIVREDILSDIVQIKENLNAYGIPLSCDLIVPDINNKNLSDLGRVGLQIDLYSSYAMGKNSPIDDEDYFIIDNKKDHIDKLNVYGLVRKEEAFFIPKHKPEKKIYMAYNIKNTEGKTRPEKKQIYKKLLNITEIFADFGFTQQKPEKDFYTKSIIEKSYWKSFFKTSILKIGMSYKELLETVYTKNNSTVWLEKEKYWDGEKFNG